MLGQIYQLSLVSRYSRSTLRKNTADQNQKSNHCKRERYNSCKVQRVSQPTCRPLEVLAKALLAIRNRPVMKMGYVGSQNAGPQMLIYPNLYPVSQPKIHHLESLLNHNI
jgi:hypothetical protein